MPVIRSIAAGLMFGLVTLPALAQGDPPSTQGLKTSSNCGSAAASATPSTQPAPAAADGTAPGNTGSTGWSGGTGGSYVGTVPAGSNPASKTWQPATARGLDLLGAPQSAKAC